MSSDTPAPAENAAPPPPPPAPAAPPPSPAKPALFVAHSLVLAVQDATDNLRHTTTVAQTAIGVALSRFMASGNPHDLHAIEPAQRAITDATHSLSSLAAQAASTLRTLAEVPTPKAPETPAP